jgi:diguanylate cyclase (GGDEF)-like protein
MRGLFITENGRWIRHFAPTLAVGIVGVVVSISIWYLMAASENRAFRQEFAGRASNQASILQNGIDEYLDKLYSVRALFDSSQQVTRGNFETFSKSLLDSHAAILNIAWVPRVKRGERVAHELAAARDGLPDYHIRAVASEGSLPVSPERNEYFPKLYSTEARTAPVYGLDLKDGGAREQTLNHIRDGNVLSTSAPLLLHIGEGDRRGFYAGLPVYAHGLPHETVEDRRNNLLGIVQGVFQIGVMIDTMLAGVKTPVRLYLFAPNAVVDELPIYSTSRLGAGTIEARSQAELATGLHQSFPLNFGDVQWMMMVAPETVSLMSAGYARSSIILICGLLLSGGLTSLMGAVRRHARNIEISNETIGEQNLRFDAALNNMVQGLLMYNRSGQLIVSNRRVAELFGVPWEKWKISAAGTTVPQTIQLVHDLTNVTEKNETQIIAELQSILASRRIGTVISERTDGRTFSASCAPITDGGFVITFEDITERRNAEAKISHMALHDALTNLPNQLFFREKMENRLAQLSRDQIFAVLYLDLDRFKSVNDMLGHPFGDTLLRQVAERMNGCLREGDTIARLGGDEFAILQGSFKKPNDAIALAERLIELVSAPFDLDGNQVVIGVSIGIAVAPTDAADADRLLKNADIALYRAKVDGRGTYRFFELEMDALLQARRTLELDLRKALVNGEFELYYQPLVNLEKQKISGFEALIRWNHPERGLVAPLDFIPLAEETALIVPIGEWVLRQACAEAVKWPGDITVAVNLSPAQFKMRNLSQMVMSALAQSGLPAKRLELEITESVLLVDNESTLATLHQLHNLGVRISMDDFGTGYSSLSYLRSFPFDKIKIDQSFVRDLASNVDSKAIIRAVTVLGGSLGMTTIGEGVETQEQLEYLKQEGCTEGQGYFFSKPKPAREVLKLLSKQRVIAKAVA